MGEKVAEDELLKALGAMRPSCEKARVTSRWADSPRCQHDR